MDSNKESLFFAKACFWHPLPAMESDSGEMFDCCLYGGILKLKSKIQGNMTGLFFLSTDVNLEAAKVLEIYALRWAVEVYL